MGGHYTRSRDPYAVSRVNDPGFLWMRIGLDSQLGFVDPGINVARQLGQTRAIDLDAWTSPSTIESLNGSQIGREIHSDHDAIGYR